MKPVAFLSIACLVALAPSVSLAAGSATYQQSGHSTQIYWQDDGSLRIGAAGADHYTLFQDGKMYSVNLGGDQPRVMELGGMMSAFAKQAKAQQPNLGKLTSLKATGRSESHAGISGEVYRISATQADGQQESSEVVLTNDALVEEATRAYFGSLQALTGGDHFEQFLDSLPGGKQGMLRSGDNFILTRISGDTPAASLFELPAEPQQMGQAMQRMMQALKQQRPSTPAQPSPASQPPANAEEMQNKVQEMMQMMGKKLQQLGEKMQ